MTPFAVFAPFAAAAAAGLLGHSWLDWRATRPQVSARPRRSPRLFGALPDFLELLALALSSGHSLGAAWPAAARFLPDGPLRREAESAAAALAYGRPADQCMTELAERVNDPRASMALALVAQAFVMGNAVEPALLSQAASLRRLRLTDVERRAQTAPLRMMLPVLGLILPAVMTVLIAPIVLRLLRGAAFF